jgi:hypothetical protein
MAIDYQLGLDPWKGVSSKPMRRPVQEPRRAWNDVPAAELRHSSGKEGSKLTADRLYPGKPNPTYAQAQLAANARGDASPLGTGKAKWSQAKVDAWKARAEKIRKAES